MNLYIMYPPMKIPNERNKLFVNEIIPLIWVLVLSVVISMAILLKSGLAIFIREDLKKKDTVIIMMP